MFKTPFTKALVFSVFPLTYYLIGYLNHARAGKIALIGVLLIGSLLALKPYFPDSKKLRYLTFFTLLVLFVNMSFHAGLKDIFGVAQEENAIMAAIFSTDQSESTEFFLHYRWYLIKHTVLCFVLFTLYLRYVINPPFSQTSPGRQRWQLVLFLLLTTVIHLNPSLYRSNPFIYFPYYYNNWQEALRVTARLVEELDANLKISNLDLMTYTGEEEKKTVVLVIGESDTRHNWSLYGYNRKTTPLLDGMKAELVVFENIHAAAPATLVAFLHMLTPATIEEPERWKTDPDILLMAKHAGYHVTYISNHSTDAHKGIIKIFSEHGDEIIRTNRGKSRGEGSYDAILLGPFEKALAANHDKKFIIVHMLGSHPAYNFRYPDSYSIFTDTYNDPVTLDLKEKGRAKWALTFRNLYDNSIVYGDMVRHRLIEILKNSKDAKHSTWLYLPDHGQDVCHNDNYSGHNYTAPEQWEIPMVFWSPSFEKVDPSIASRPYRVDLLDHTVLGLLGIEGIYYNENNDIFSDRYISNFKKNEVESRGTKAVAKPES